jgi:hypothetical protein
MNWSAAKGQFVVLASLMPLAWCVSVLENTNGGWGSDPEFAVPWMGRSLAGWSAAVGAAALVGAAFWRPGRWTILAPALVGLLSDVARRLFPIGSPPYFFLHDQPSARWVAVAFGLLQLMALALTLVPPVRSRESGVRSQK